jgi:hypothetical protein
MIEIWFIKALGANWKTTINGVLALLITTLSTVSTFMVGGNIVTGGATPSSIHVSTWFVLGVNLTLALCRAWVGMIQKDAKS